MNFISFMPLLVCMLPLVGATAMAAPPVLYRQPSYQSPARGEPDDLLLLAGYGLSADDTVVYRALADSTRPLAPPGSMPGISGAQVGLASVVSAADVPHSLTIKLPTVLIPGQTYALWVRSARGEWSQPVTINDARPLWISPAYVYSSAMPGSLPRALKVVGRNLQPSVGQTTRVKLIGPQVADIARAPDDGGSSELQRTVARFDLPRLTPGSYRIQVSRDGTSWVPLDGQTLEVLADPKPVAQFSVSDPQFGGCRPDDGIDDTACIVRAIAAAQRAGGGVVNFGPGTWDLIDATQPGLVAGEGIVVSSGVQLHGAGSSLTRLERHAKWNAPLPTAAFTLVGRTQITGFTFLDLQVYQPSNRAGAFLQLGEDFQRLASVPAPLDAAIVKDVEISQNTFDKVFVAVGSGGLPISRLFITHNTFGAYNSALELAGDQYNMVYKFRIDDSVIDSNVFRPGGKVDLIQKTGAIASELGAGHRVDFSGNSADGASTDHLYAPSDAKGWRAAFFWNLNNNVEETLVSENTASCTGDKIGDGEAISFDNNTNTFALGGAALVARAGPDSVTVSVPMALRQNHRDVPIASYYVDHWVQVVSGPGLGQTRKIVGYAIDATTHVTTIRIAPAWDVVPIPGRTRITVGREFWQLFVVDNEVDNRQPLCQKSNRSRHAAGEIVLWAQSADSVIAGNRQFDSDGIFVQQTYAVPEHACADCTMQSFLQSFLDIRGNLVDGEYDWSIDCSASGIILGIGAAPWGDAPPTVGYGVSMSHNTIRHADGLHGGAIGQTDSWSAGPEPHRWPLSESVLIHHNSISDIAGAKALAICGRTSPPRLGIAFPDPAIAWRTVLYANSCKNVSRAIGQGGMDVVKVCPSTAVDSCECAASK